MKLKFNGNVLNGKFIPDNPNFRECFVLHEGKRVTITVGREQKNRSLPENSYFHGVVVKILSDELGYTPVEMKGVIKWVFKVKHTSDLSTVEFEDLMEKIRRWAAMELNINIPVPNEVDYSDPNFITF